MSTITNIKLKRKKLISVLLSAVLLITMLPAQAVAAADESSTESEATSSPAPEATATPVPWQVAGNIMWQIADDVLTISPKTGLTSAAMPDYTSTNVNRGTIPWMNSQYASIVIADGITHIGNYAFYQSSSAIKNTLESCVIGADVQTIGDYAFAFRADIETIDFSRAAELTTIGKYAFSQIPFKNGIDLSGAVKLTTIEASAFSQASFESIDLSGNTALTTIGAKAIYMNKTLKSLDLSQNTALTTFSDCQSNSALTIVKLPSSVEETVSFDGCTNLRAVVGLENTKVTTLGSGAFRNTSMEYVKLPATVSKINTQAFKGVTKAIEIPTENLTIADADLGIFKNAFDGATVYVRSATEQATVRAALAEVDAYAGDADKDEAEQKIKVGTLKTPSYLDITVENNTLDVEDVRNGSAFTPNVTEQIGDGAVTYSYYIMSGSNYVLADSENPTAVPQTAGTYYIQGSTAETDTYLDCRSNRVACMITGAYETDEYSFDSETGVMTIKADMESIGSLAETYPNYKELVKEIQWESGKTYTKVINFKGLTALEKVTNFPALESYPGDILTGGFFDGCSALTEVTFAEGVKEIPAYCFRSSGLTSITIPETVTKIDQYAFSGSQLTSITIPAAVTEIGSSAFASTKLTSVAFGTDPQLETIGSNAFSSVTTLKSMTLPDGIQKLQSVFSGAGLTSITIPASVTDIYGAFTGCVSLESVTFAEGSALTSIGYGAFRGTTALKRIELPSTITSIDNYAFYESGLEQIFIPLTVTSLTNKYSFSSSKIKKIYAGEAICSFLKTQGFSSSQLVQIEPLTGADYFLWKGSWKKTGSSDTCGSTDYFLKADGATATANLLAGEGSYWNISNLDLSDMQTPALEVDYTGSDDLQIGTEADSFNPNLAAGKMANGKCIVTLDTAVTTLSFAADGGETEFTQIKLYDAAKVVTPSPSPTPSPTPQPVELGENDYLIWTGSWIKSGNSSTCGSTAQFLTAEGSSAVANPTAGGGWNWNISGLDLSSLQKPTIEVQFLKNDSTGKVQVSVDAFKTDLAGKTVGDIFTASLTNDVTTVSLATTEYPGEIYIVKVRIYDAPIDPNETPVPTMKPLEEDEYMRWEGSWMKNGEDNATSGFLAAEGCNAVVNLNSGSGWNFELSGLALSEFENPVLEVGFNLVSDDVLQIFKASTFAEEDQLTGTLMANGKYLFELNKDMTSVWFATADSPGKSAITSISLIDYTTARMKSELTEVISSAEELVESDYTEASWATFKTALDAAKAMIDNEDATGDDIKEASDTLSDAIAKLKKATSATPTPAPTPAPTATPTPAPGTNATPTPKPLGSTTLKVGATFTAGKFKYKVTGAAAVAVQAPKSKTAKSLTIPATVKASGTTYKVTSIAASAFKSCKKLKKITIGKNVATIGKNAFNKAAVLKTITVKATKLKSVGKAALKGIHKKAVIKVPKKQLKAYKKLFKGKGQKKTVKIK